MKNMIRLMAFLLLAALYALACQDSSDGPAGPSVAEPGPALKTVVDTGDADCPSGAPDCRPATPLERERMRASLSDHIRWEEPPCAAYGQAMLNAITAGRIATFSSWTEGGSRILGFWRRASRWVGYDRALSYIYRARVGVHEGYHDVVRGGTEPFARKVESSCIDY